MQIRRILDFALLLLWAWIVILLTQGCGTPRVSNRATPPPPTPQRTANPAPLKGRVVEESFKELAAPRDVVHEVGPLETVWRLSKMYEVPREHIYRANGLKPGDTIHIGQKLVIPGARRLRHVIPLYPSSTWRYIVVHHTASDIGNASLIHGTHLDRGFWHGLGYHFLIDNGTLGKGDGQIEVAPRWIKQQSGAHCKASGMNECSIGVALVGNFNQGVPSTEQISSLAYLLGVLTRQYHIPPERVIGHQDVPGARTDCPGKHFPWAEMRRSLAERP